jgi:hypothetical protein
VRALTDRARLDRFMVALGRSTTAPARVFLTGGATAVLYGWRLSTVDVDLKLLPERDDLLRAIASLKDDLDINVELASPDAFIPVPPGWESRGAFIARHGAVDFHHFEFTAQALAKIERGHAQDREDVAAMLTRGLVTPAQLRATFAAITPDLFRYPAIDPSAFGRAIEATLAGAV